MSRVLFATDLSEAACTAGRLIENLPWPSDTTFRLVTVVPWPTDPVGTPWLMAGPVDAERLEETQIARAREGLAEAAARLATHGRDVSWIVMRGQAADAIVDVARREGVDLVVVGSRGLGAIEGAPARIRVGGRRRPCAVPRPHCAIGRDHPEHRRRRRFAGRRSGDRVCRHPHLAARCRHAIAGGAFRRRPVG